MICFVDASFTIACIIIACEQSVCQVLNLPVCMLSLKSTITKQHSQMFRKQV